MRRLQRLLSSAVPFFLFFSIVLYGVLVSVGGSADDEGRREHPHMNDSTIVAVLGNSPIHERDFQIHLQSMYSNDEVVAINNDSHRYEHLLNDFLNMQALWAKAKQMGLHYDEHYQKALELMEIKLLSKMMNDKFREAILNKSMVSDDDVRAYYETHKHNYLEQPYFTAHHLIVYVKGNPAFPQKGYSAAVARKKAMEALAKLRSGESWDTVVRDYSHEKSSGRKGGLLRKGRFGFFAHEVEGAIKSQSLGKPGNVVQSDFGYHVVEVVERVVQPIPQPFEKLREVLKTKLTDQKLKNAGQQIIEPIRREMGLFVFEAAKRKATLLDRSAVKENEQLAVLNGKPVYEKDFQWFIKDAFVPSQRMNVFSKNDARQKLLQSFFTMLVLTAKARKEKLDKSKAFIRSSTEMEQRLLLEFSGKRNDDDPHSTSFECLVIPEEGLPLKSLIERIRAEVGLHIVADAASRH